MDFFAQIVMYLSRIILSKTLLVESEIQSNKSSFLKIFFKTSKLKNCFVYFDFFLKMIFILKIII